MVALGIDLGGSKLEAQLFAPDWRLIDRMRVPTPPDYPALVAAVAAAIAWGETHAASAGRTAPLPVGIAAAGAIHPATGLALTANLAATGHPFPADIARVAGRPVTFLKDSQALTLSEARLGAARGLSPAVVLILGTGIGGGIALAGRLVEAAGGLAGEVGHAALPAAPVVARGLPVLRCGCGRTGCAETLLAGPGLGRLAQHLSGRALTAPQIGALRGSDPDAARVWSVWCALAAELLVSLTLTVDPRVIVLAGGLSRIEGLVPDLTAAFGAAMLPGWPAPPLVLAEGGDASGARGAALAARDAAGPG